MQNNHGFRIVGQPDENGAETDKNAGSLAEKLTGYWAALIWALRDCPVATEYPARRMGKLDFRALPQNIGIELRYALYMLYTMKKWFPTSLVMATQIRKIIRFLSDTYPHGESLLERSLDAWNLALRTWLVEKGEYYESTRTYIDKDYEEKEITNGNACLSAFGKIYAEIERAYDRRPEWDLDVWDLRRIGIQINPTKSEFRLSFTAISLTWLKEAAKKYMRHIVTHLSASSCTALLHSIRVFGKFIVERHPDLKPQDINRPLALEYSSYLLEEGRSPASRRDLLLDLNTFIERAAREEWLPVSGKRLIFREDLPPVPRRQPRFIPESVMSQIEAHLPKMEELWRDMMTVLIEGGMRVSELCTIELNCLSQDADEDYFLTYYQHKLKKYHTIPISVETAEVIKGRIEKVRQEGKETVYLFSFHPGNPVRQSSFSKKIRAFFHEHQIRDDAGRLWHFQPHQLRHTVGTRMINNGVKQIFVQRFLGHETPVMTGVYAHIHDKTLKDEYEKYMERRGKIIGIDGSSVAGTEPDAGADAADLQWFKKNVLAQALPNGYCGLPLPQGGCPHANACLTCAHFQTDRTFLPQHRAQLTETRRLVQIARTNRWERQVEMNEKVEKNLEKIINALEMQEVDGNGQDSGEKAA